LGANPPEGRWFEPFECGPFITGIEIG
jgi:hypothetical protein